MPETRRTLLHSLVIVAVLAAPLFGCDIVQQQMGIENPAAKAARNEAEGRAVGGACRQSGRAIEDCYAIYSWLPKSSIYDGWRDMDAYMRENKLETVEPQLPPVPPPNTKKRPAANAAPAAKNSAEK